MLTLVVWPRSLTYDDVVAKISHRFKDQVIYRDLPKFLRSGLKEGLVLVSWYDQPLYVLQLLSMKPEVYFVKANISGILIEINNMVPELKIDESKTCLEKITSNDKHIIMNCLRVSNYKLHELINTVSNCQGNQIIYVSWRNKGVISLIDNYLTLLNIKHQVISSHDQYKDLKANIIITSILPHNVITNTNHIHLLEFDACVLFEWLKVCFVADNTLTIQYYIRNNEIDTKYHYDHIVQCHDEIYNALISMGTPL